MRGKEAGWLDELFLSLFLSFLACLVRARFLGWGGTGWDGMDFVEREYI